MERSVSTKPLVFKKQGGKGVHHQHVLNLGKISCKKVHQPTQGGGETTTYAKGGIVSTMQKKQEHKGKNWGGLTQKKTFGQNVG